jgi:LAO/AO transport system kinase
MMDKIDDLVDHLSTGSVCALARLITVVENKMPGAVEAMKRLYPKTGHAYIVGITGPPGSGKSTLTDKIARNLRKRGYTVGIVAIDPSSPFRGGALLGDRLRMQDIANDEGVFFRSMATRGAMGGLSRATTDTVKILDAFGKDFILLETVGVGQDEVDIVRTADSTLLISVPGLGDGIQALKAGIMEIGNIYVVNKADRDGADRLVMELSLMRDLSSSVSSSISSWTPPILKTIATKDEGIVELTEKIFEHRKFLEDGNGLLKKRNERVKREIINLIEMEISEYIHKMINDNMVFDNVIDQIAAGKRDPYSFAQTITDPIAQYYQIYKADHFKT